MSHVRRRKSASARHCAHLPSPQLFRGPSLFDEYLQHSQKRPLHFQHLAHSFTSAKNITLAFPFTSALFLHSFAQERKSTPLLSCACALFQKSTGGGGGGGESQAFAHMSAPDFGADM